MLFTLTIEHTRTLPPNRLIIDYYSYLQATASPNIEPQSFFPS